MMSERDAAVVFREMVVVDRLADIRFDIRDGQFVTQPEYEDFPAIYGVESQGQFTTLPSNWQPASDPESSWL